MKRPRSLWALYQNFIGNDPYRSQFLTIFTSKRLSSKGHLVVSNSHVLVWKPCKMSQRKGSIVFPLDKYGEDEPLMNWSSVIPKKFDGGFTANVADVAKAVEAAVRAVKATNMCVFYLDIDHKQLTIRSRGDSGLQIASTLGITVHDGTRNVVFALNGDYVLGALPVSAKSIQFSFTDPHSPVLMQFPDEEGEYKDVNMLIMPMKAPKENAGG